MLARRQRWRAVRRQDEVGPCPGAGSARQPRSEVSADAAWRRREEHDVRAACARRRPRRRRRHRAALRGPDTRRPTPRRSGWVPRRRWVVEGRLRPMPPSPAPPLRRLGAALVHVTCARPPGRVASRDAPWADAACAATHVPAGHTTAPRLQPTLAAAARGQAVDVPGCGRDAVWASCRSCSMQDSGVGDRLPASVSGGGRDAAGKKGRCSSPAWPRLAGVRATPASTSPTESWRF